MSTEERQHPGHPLYSSNFNKLKAIRLLFWMFFFSAVLVPFFTEWGGLSLAQVFFLNAWFFFWNFVLEIPTGAIADHLGRKRSLALGCLFGIAATITYAWKPDFRFFLAAEILFAIAYCFHSGADEALAYDSLLAMGQESQAKRIITRMESFKLGGIIIGTLSGGFIASAWGLRAPMLAYCCPALLAFLVTLTLKEPPHHEMRLAKPRFRELIWQGGRVFVSHPILLLLSLDLAISNSLAWAIIWLFQPLLGQAGVSLKHFGIVQALGCIGQIVLLSHVERIERLLGSQKRLLTASSILCGASFLVLGSTHSKPAVILAIVIAFTFGLSRVAIFGAYLNRHIPSEIRATLLSITSMIRTLAIVIMNPIAGYFAERQMPETLFALGTGLIILPFFSGIKEEHLETQTKRASDPSHRSG